jgi:hypothetical protein
MILSKDKKTPETIGGLPTMKATIEASKLTRNQTSLIGKTNMEEKEQQH